MEAPQPDVVLLDLGLPDIDGYEVCRRMRATSDVPILFLTARSDEIDRVVGLELGADDYVVKPFGFRELVARIRAVVRRRGPERRQASNGGGPLRVDGLEVDRRARRVVLGGGEIDLTPKEFELVARLVTDPGGVFERRRTMEEVWGQPLFGPTKALDLHVPSAPNNLGQTGWIETL